MVTVATWTQYPLGILVAVQTLKETYVRVPGVFGGFEPPPDLSHNARGVFLI